MKTAPMWDEVRQEERVKMARKWVRDVLEARYPGTVPAAVVQRIGEEAAALGTLERWHKLAITATLEAFQQGMG